MKRIIIFSGFILLIVCLCSCNNIHRYGCGSRDWYTDEEHYERVRKKVIERYIESGIFTKCEIYPLYNVEDKLEYFLLEFTPEAHGYVSINETDSSCIIGPEMYTIDRNLKVYNGNTWNKYTIIDDEIIYEKDSEGNDVIYHHSPFKENNVLNEKIYLLEVFGGINKNDYGYIPAVKRDGKILNLISLKVISVSTICEEGQFEVEHISFIPKASFNL